MALIMYGKFHTLALPIFAFWVLPNVVTAQSDEKSGRGDPRVFENPPLLEIIRPVAPQLQARVAVPKGMPQPAGEAALGSGGCLYQQQNLEPG